MGKKKGQNHIQQSMGQMVSKAALAQMGPAIENYIQRVVQQLGQQLAMQSASTLETMFSRIVVLETILMEKYGLTKEDLASKVADLEDSKKVTLFVLKLKLKPKIKLITKAQLVSRSRTSDLEINWVKSLKLRFSA
jgi:hypothetical protein